MSKRINLRSTDLETVKQGSNVKIGKVLHQWTILYRVRILPTHSYNESQREKPRKTVHMYDGFPFLIFENRTQGNTPQTL